MRMRTLLCAAGLGLGLLLLTPALAGAQEGSLSQSDAAEEVKGIGEKAGLDHNVIECLHGAAVKNDTKGCIESPSPIIPAANEIIYGGIAFVILFAVLAKIGLPMAAKMMNERAERIEASLAEAESAKVEAQTVLAEYQRQLADARNEAARIVEEARQQAEQVRRDLTARAEAEAAELRSRNAEQVAAEAGRVQGELQQQVADLAIDLAERVVGANLDREANLRLIEDYINSVGAR